MCAMRLIIINCVILSIIAYKGSWGSTDLPSVEQVQEKLNFVLGNETVINNGQSEHDLKQLNDSPKAADYMNVAVRDHNKYRKRHRSPPVQLGGADINRFAQRYANKLAKEGTFEHSGGPYGENLYKSWGGSKDKSVQISKAIKSWYDEVKKYNYNKPGFSEATGHFTQVVWKATKEIGIGIASFEDRKYGHGVVVVANYNPPGNYAGEFRKNVLPPN